MCQARLCECTLVATPSTLTEVRPLPLVLLPLCERPGFALVRRAENSRASRFKPEEQSRFKRFAFMGGILFGASSTLSVFDRLRK